MKFLIFICLFFPQVFSIPLSESGEEHSSDQAVKTDPLLNDVGIIVIDGIPDSWIERDRGDHGERWSSRDRWSESSRRAEERRQGTRTEDRNVGSDRRTDWEVPEAPKREDLDRRVTTGNRRRPAGNRRIVTDRLVGGDNDEDIWSEGNSDDRKPQGSRERGSSSSSSRNRIPTDSRDRIPTDSRDRIPTDSRDRIPTDSRDRIPVGGEIGERWGDQDPWRRTPERNRERWDKNRGPYNYVQNDDKTNE